MASGEVLESYSTTGVDGGTMLMQRELVVTKERAYAYWYAYQRVDHRLFRAYVGSMVGAKGIGEDKGRRRLREKIRRYDPC
jgi:hypothetical protein